MLAFLEKPRKARNRNGELSWNFHNNNSNGNGEGATSQRHQVFRKRCFVEAGILGAFSFIELRTQWNPLFQSEWKEYAVILRMGEYTLQFSLFNSLSIIWLPTFKFLLRVHFYWLATFNYYKSKEWKLPQSSNYNGCYPHFRLQLITTSILLNKIYQTLVILRVSQKNSFTELRRTNMLKVAVLIALTTF